MNIAVRHASEADASTLSLLDADVQNRTAAPKFSGPRPPADHS
jgi:hypothetical protein